MLTCRRILTHICNRKRLKTVQNGKFPLLPQCYQLLFNIYTYTYKDVIQFCLYCFQMCLLLICWMWKVLWGLWWLVTQQTDPVCFHILALQITLSSCLNWIRLPGTGQHSMWKSHQLLGKYVVWSTGVRKPRNIWIGELAAVIWLKTCWKRR